MNEIINNIKTRRSVKKYKNDLVEQEIMKELQIVL